MKYLSLLIFFVFFCIFVSAKPGKDGKPKKFPGKGLKGFASCKGQPVDLDNQIDSSSVQQCLDNRTKEIEDEFTARDNDAGKGGAKKREKKKAKLLKKMIGKCSIECEWKAYDLIPEVNGTSSYPPVEITDAFLNVFPNDVQVTLKARMETCYNITSPWLPKAEKKGFFKRNMCLMNIKLMKCLRKSLRQTCNGKGTPSPDAADITPKFEANDNVSTPRTKTAKNDNDTADDDDDDHDFDDDKEEDDEDSSEAPVTTTKRGPSTTIDTSKPITK